MKTFIVLLVGVTLGAAAVWFYSTYRNDPRMHSAEQKVENAAKNTRDAAHDKIRELHLTPEDIKDELARTGQTQRKRPAQPSRPRGATPGGRRPSAAPPAGEAGRPRHGAKPAARRRHL